jgi:NDP-sugar pyrophosphorylase family protein
MPASSYSTGSYSTTSTATTAFLGREPLERLAAEGELMAYRHEGFFFAMDTYRECKHLNELWDLGEAPWAVWGRGPHGYQLAG